MKDTKILNNKNKIVSVRGINFGEESKPKYIAGPCSVESKEQIFLTAKMLKEIGVDVLRGGAFKPRTSPYDFQGLGLKGLEYLKLAGEKYDVPIVTEIMDGEDLSNIKECADIIQVGTRNMFNYSLLKKLGRAGMPILLKRGLSATIKEWVFAAEYIAHHGNENIILCERGIRTYEDYTRNTLDISAVPIMKNETGLPIIVDPSHGTGVKEIIKPMTKAAIAAGADGIMVEVHPNPEEALSDGKQSLNFEEYRDLIK